MYNTPIFYIYSIKFVPNMIITDNFYLNIFPIFFKCALPAT